MRKTGFTTRMEPPSPPLPLQPPKGLSSAINWCAAIQLWHQPPRVSPTHELKDTVHSMTILTSDQLSTNLEGLHDPSEVWQFAGMTHRSQESTIFQTTVLL